MGAGGVEPSTVNTTGAVAVLPAGSREVIVGFDPIADPAPVQTMVELVAAFGTQVVPGMTLVEPTSTPVHVIETLAAGLAGFGVAVHTGAAGATVSLVVALVPVPVLPAASVCAAATVTGPSGSALTSTGPTDHVPLGGQDTNTGARVPMVTVTLPSPAVQVPVVV